MVEQRPVQTSAVYILGASQFPAVPPPSPPSPATPEPSELCTPIEDLDLGEGASSHHVSGPVTIYDDRLAGAVHVLSTEATTLQCLARLYSTDHVARDGFSRAVVAVTRHRVGGGGCGKIVVVGVGKSGHIGRKLVATFNSLGVHAAFLHPTEALHGDLGQIGPDDTILLITYSGRTPELLALLPHLDASLPLILLTAHTRPDTCELLTTARRHPSRSCYAEAGDVILLPAPVHETEFISFGVAAPTSSTTAALAVGDALAIVAAQELYGRSAPVSDGFGGGVGAVFSMNHPGGAIGATSRRETSVSSSDSLYSSTSASSSSPSLTPPSTSSSRAKRRNNRDSTSASRHHHHRGREKTRHLAIPWSDIPTVTSPGVAVKGADVLCAAYASASGWVRLSPDDVVPPSRARRLRPQDMDRPVGELTDLTVRRADFIAVAADTSLRRAAEWISGIGANVREAEGDEGCTLGVVIGVVEGGECIGVLEADELSAEKPR